MGLKLRALLCACLVGCASVDLDLAVERGQARWYAATGRRPAPTYVGWTHDRECGGSGQAVGCSNAREGWVTVWVGVRTQDYADFVMLHELGHLLSDGRGHVQPGWGVMAPTLELTRTRITQSDLDLVCLGFLCPWERPESDR